MQVLDKNQLAGYLRLLKRHRGELVGSYNEVASAYDGFAAVWDNHIAGEALAFYRQVIRERITPGMFVLDADPGTGERTETILRETIPARVFSLDASKGSYQ